jgi:hypothetical protein
VFLAANAGHETADVPIAFKRLSNNSENLQNTIKHDPTSN